MKQTPLLFSTDMVRALLEGRKTMTRRMVKPQPEMPPPVGYAGHTVDYIEDIDKWSMYAHHPDAIWRPWGEMFKSPYGKAGDLIWVRETFGESPMPKTIRKVYRADMTEFGVLDSGSGYSVPAFPSKALYPDKAVKWKSPYHMFKKYSRLTLKITDIRVERLQEITEEDAKAEGCKSADLATGRECFLSPELGRYSLYFQSLWNSINGKKYPWDSNPYVWVISFEVINQNILDYVREDK